MKEYKHTDAAIEAADVYALQHPMMYDDYNKAFLAGVEHFQNDIQELVEAGSKVIDVIDFHNTMGYDGLHSNEIDEFEKLIQKYKRKEPGNTGFLFNKLFYSIVAIY